MPGGTKHMMLEGKNAIVYGGGGAIGGAAARAFGREGARVFLAGRTVGFIGASQFAAKLGERFGMARVVTVAVSCFAAIMTLLLVVTAAGVDNLAALIAMLFVGNAFLGLVIPTTMVLSLDDHGTIAGMASALGGTLQMIAGGLVIVIVSYFFDGTTLPMVAAIALCALAALALAYGTLGFRASAPQPAE